MKDGSCIVVSGTVGECARNEECFYCGVAVRVSGRQWCCPGCRGGVLLNSQGCNCDSQGAGSRVIGIPPLSQNTPPPSATPSSGITPQILSTTKGALLDCSMNEECSVCGVAVRISGRQWCCPGCSRGGIRLTRAGCTCDPNGQGSSVKGIPPVSKSTPSPSSTSSSTRAKTPESTKVMYITTSTKVLSTTKVALLDCSMNEDCSACRIAVRISGRQWCCPGCSRGGVRLTRAGCTCDPNGQGSSVKGIPPVSKSTPSPSSTSSSTRAKTPESTKVMTATKSTKVLSSTKVALLDCSMNEECSACRVAVRISGRQWCCPGCSRGGVRLTRSGCTCDPNGQGSKVEGTPPRIPASSSTTKGIFSKSSTSAMHSSISPSLSTYKFSTRVVLPKSTTPAIDNASSESIVPQTITEAPVTMTTTEVSVTTTTPKMEQCAINQGCSSCRVAVRIGNRQWCCRNCKGGVILTAAGCLCDPKGQGSKVIGVPSGCARLFAQIATLFLCIAYSLL